MGINNIENTQAMWDKVQFYHIVWVAFSKQFNEKKEQTVDEN